MRQNFHLLCNGFYGSLYTFDSKDFVIILYVDDDPNSFIGRGAVKWFKSKKINILAMSPQRKNTGFKEVPIDHIEHAVQYLKEQGFKKIGIMGLSITAMTALVAASLIPDLTLTIVATPCDFVPEGTIQDGLDGAKERPAGVTSLTYHGRPLPYVPYSFKHPDYWNQIKMEGKRRNDFLAAFDLFEDAERKHPVQEEEYIKVENIQGRLLLVGAKDDVMWNTTKYIQRMIKRLESHPHSCTYESLIFEHGTHYVFPEGIIKKILPFWVDLLLPKLFSEAKGYTKECRDTRLQIERTVLELCKGDVL